MSKLNLMDEIQGMDVEGFGTVAAEALDFESIMTMDVEEAEFQAQAEETEKAVDAFEEASEIAVEVQEEIQETLENIEEMTPVAVGKALGAIAEKASDIADVAETAVDAEAMDADFKAGARLELEAISDSIKKAWEAVKNFFRSVWAKIKQLVHNVGLWVVNGEKKTKSVADKLAKKDKTFKNDKMDEAKEKAAKSIVGARGVFSDLLLKDRGALNDWLSGLTDMNKLDKGSDALEKLVKSKASEFKGIPALDSTTSLKLVRCDGKSAKAVVLKKFEGVNGYSSYVTIQSPKFELAAEREQITAEVKAIATASAAYDEAKIALENATIIQKSIKATKDALYKEMGEVGKQVDGDVEKVKFDQGFFKMVWSDTLGKKTAEQLTANEKVRLVRNRASFTSRYTFDVLYGLNGLANGQTRAAVAYMSLLKDSE